MTGCVAWLLVLGFAIFSMVTLIRWFDVVTDAVDDGRWNHVWMLVLIPLTAWRFLSKVSTGRPSAVPHHEPVQGFGAPAGPGDRPKPPPKKKRAPVDPDLVAKLRQKMMDQGMLDEKDE